MIFSNRFRKTRCCYIEPRDITILKKIIEYCTRIQDNLDHYERSYDAFKTDHLFQDACCMCVVQIGELVALLSDNIKNMHKNIPWRIIKDTRNFYVHAYGSIDTSSVWDTLCSDIPALLRSCQEILNAQ